MGLLQKIISIARPSSDGSSSIPVIHHQQFRHHILIKSIGALALIIAFGGLVSLSQPKTNKATGSLHNSNLKVNVSNTNNKPTQNASSNAGSGLSTDSSMQSSQSVNSSGGSNSSLSVTVNGQAIPVPQNGSSHTTLSSPNGSTNVNVSSNSSGSGVSVNSNTSSTSINTNSSSSSDNSLSVQEVTNSP